MLSRLSKIDHTCCQGAKRPLPDEFLFPRSSACSSVRRRKESSRATDLIAMTSTYVQPASLSPASLSRPPWLSVAFSGSLGPDCPASPVGLFCARLAAVAASLLFREFNFEQSPTSSSAKPAHARKFTSDAPEI